MPRDRDSRKLRNVRHRRVRKKVSGSPEQPRLCVFRSLRSIYAQIIDDTDGRTLVAVSSQEANQEAGNPIQSQDGSLHLRWDRCWPSEPLSGASAGWFLTVAVTSTTAG